MAMFNDLFELLADVPPMLVTAWAVWLGVGVLIVVWFRRVQYDVQVPAPAPRPAAARPKPVARPSSSPDMLASDATDAAAERSKPPVVVGDPYGDLATLLDQPATAAPAEPRAPAESPILSSSGSPIRPQIKHRLDTDPQ
jgi:hypothetical protein